MENKKENNLIKFILLKKRINNFLIKNHKIEGNKPAINRQQVDEWKYKDIELKATRNLIEEILIQIR